MTHRDDLARKRIRERRALGAIVIGATLSAFAVFATGEWPDGVLTVAIAGGAAFALWYRRAAVAANLSGGGDAASSGGR